MWRYEPEQNKHGEWKLTKVPYIPQVDNPRHAASNRPKEWHSLQVALTVLMQDWARKNGGFYDGLGFMFQGSGYSGVDLDHVLTEGGDLPSWVEKLIAEELHDTYIERSIGGEGLHGFLRGGFLGESITKKFRDGTAFELYCAGRYFAMSCNPYNGAAAVIGGNPQSLHDRFKRGEIGPDDFRAEQAAKEQKRRDGPKRKVDVEAAFERYQIDHGDPKEDPTPV